MPLKPVKRGIKVWLRADSVNHFVSRFEVYTGKPRQGQEHGLGEQVVKTLSRDLVNGNYHLFFAKDLLDDGIYSTATTRANRKDFPEQLKLVKLSRSESKTFQRNGVTACSWQDKKTVRFPSTSCNATRNDTVLWRKREAHKSVSMRRRVLFHTTSTWAVLTVLIRRGTSIGSL